MKKGSMRSRGNRSLIKTRRDVPWSVLNGTDCLCGYEQNKVFTEKHSVVRTE